MSKAEAGIKLVRWLPQIARATADEVARFGPQAARVRGLLDFIPTLGPEGRIIAGSSLDNMPSSVRDPAVNSAWNAAVDHIRVNARDDASNSARRALYTSLGKGEKFDDAAAAEAMRMAAWGEVLSDVVEPQSYRTLTAPLAAGRAFDVLRPRAPENFLDVVRGLGERGLVQQPVDVLGARTLARASDPERRALMEVIDAIAGDAGYADTGYDSLAELIEAARLLG